MGVKGKARARASTRRRRSASASATAHSTKILEVRSPSQIPALEAALAKGPMTLVLVFADWCPACHRFMKNLWKPMCNGKSPSSMNRVAVREDLVAKTSLANSQYKYLPTLMLVGPDKRPATFESPEGKTNAMPTPQTPEELKRITQLESANTTGVSTPLPPMSPTPTPPPMNTAGPMPMTSDEIPRNETAPQKGGCGCMLQQGGGLYDTLMQIRSGNLPFTRLLKQNKTRRHRVKRH
jgi:thiol-disulfide isomerase/thioredoxin